MAIPGATIAGKLLKKAGGKFGKKALAAIPVVGAGIGAYDAYSNYNEATAAGDDPGRAATRGIFSTLGGVGGGALGALAGGGVASFATGIAGGVGGRAAGDALGAKLWDKYAKVPEVAPPPMTAPTTTAATTRKKAPTAIAAGRFRFGADTPELAMAEMNVDAGKYVTDSRERLMKGGQYNERYAQGLQAGIARGDQYNERYMGGLQTKMVAGSQMNERYMGGLNLAAVRDSNRTQRDIQFGGFGVENRRTEAGRQIGLRGIESQRQIGLSGIEANRQIGLDQGVTSRFNTKTMVGGQVRINLDNNITQRQGNQLQAGVMNNQTFANERTAQRQFEAQKFIGGSGDLRTKSQLALGLDTNKTQRVLGLDTNATQRYLGGSGDRRTDAQVEMARIAAGASQGQQQFQQQSMQTANYNAYLADERNAQRQRKQMEEQSQLGYLGTLGSLYR